MDLFDYIIWRIDTFSIIEFPFNISSALSEYLYQFPINKIIIMINN